MAKLRQPGWWYPLIFVGGMLLVIAVNAVLVAYAIGTFPGLETRDHYRKGLAYNDAIASARARDERGWQMDLVFTPRADGDSPLQGELLVTFVDRDGRALRNLNVEATLFRPTHEGFDQTLELDARGAGKYARDVTLPLSGQWEARVRAHREGDSFHMNRRITVP